MEENVSVSRHVKPEPAHRGDLSARTKSISDNPFTPQYTLPPGTDHMQPMQIPSHSEPPVAHSKYDQSSAKDSDLPDEDPIDSESIKGIFGWETVDDTSIPYILRKKKKFVSVRIVERKLLSKYPNTFPDELGKKDPLVSYFITDAEAKLLNEINTAHCDYEYGHNPFTVKDLIVDLEEFEEFFKIVKKTFPADVLAKIGGEVTTSHRTSPTKPELSQYCGWMQINNTVSPYILRTEGSKQVKLVPLSVIVYAAGLLTNTSVDGLLPTPQECALLNEACKAAGFEFTFGKNTRLISITEVLQRCQVQLFDLPFKNPFQHARYLDPRTGLPSSSPLLPPVSHPVTMPSMVHHQSTVARPSSRGQQQTNLELMAASGHPELNPFLSIFQRQGFPASQLSSTLHDYHGNTNSSMLRPSPGLSMEPPRLSSQRPHSASEKNIDTSGSAASAMPGSLWAIMPRGPPPAHANNVTNTSLMSKTPPIQPETPISSAYQVPSHPQLHQAKHSSSIPDINHPIFRGSHNMSSRAGQMMAKDNSGHMVRYPPPVTGLPPSPQQYSPNSPFQFGVNQFESSLFARTDAHEQRLVRDALGVSQPTRRLSSESPQNNTSHYSSLSHQNNNIPRSNMDQSFQLGTGSLSCASNNNHHKADLSQMISACLVNGKSISCLTVNTPSRAGNFCLVEAVSKLYFPTVPLSEFVKVLQYVLKVNLYECTAEEEKAFVQYYNLPVSKLKCNKIIKVHDLENYFPQLNYMFTKSSADQPQLSGKPATHPSMKRRSSSPMAGVYKRSNNSPLPGPSAKMLQPKHDNLSHSSTSNGDSNSQTSIQIL
ncbi:uncharacterized protein LOC131952374 isoform X2 [Physella acuta]|uniref:uncharacterized protein LOC131952374 isoform X2 n=1 Tax=Physella acuta TaxID=109671 RepID=UPI0027DBD635|nr:uncharacterized protein LOC131952374 isoform X2 [Physella acuta]